MWVVRKWSYLYGGADSHSRDGRVVQTHVTTDVSIIESLCFFMLAENQPIGDEDCLRSDSEELWAVRSLAELLPKAKPRGGDKYALSRYGPL